MDIVVWLRSLGLGKYEALFRENDIDETVLLSLTAEDLKELGVTSFGHRRKILDAIAALRSDVSVQTPPLVAPSTATLTSAPVAEAVGERRHVTVMFCDLVGSTSISAGLDAEDWRDLVGAYLDAASAAVTEMGGHVAKKLGDGLMALFGYPLARDRCRLLSTFAHTNSVMVSRQTKTLFDLRTTILRLCDFDAKSFSNSAPDYSCR